MAAALYVGLGGFFGAMARYGMGLIPWAGEFPLITMVVNFLGSVLIGVVVQAAQTCNAPSNLVLFAKTGLCGGFTTFSTFSLETLTLFEKGRYATATGYALCSVLVCVAGVFLGKLLAQTILSRFAG